MSRRIGALPSPGMPATQWQGMPRGRAGVPRSPAPLERELAGIRQLVVLMGEEVDRAITRAVCGLLDRDVDVCAGVIAQGARLHALQGELRRKVLDLIGGLPADRTALNPRVTGTLAGDGYRIEKVVFESVPGFHVTALLYVPEAPAGPKPAVLLACGHSPIGKAYPSYQEIAIRLVRRGYVVLCWDPVGQGERSQFWDATRGRSRYNLVCGEHAVLGNLAVLAGASLLRWEVWDGMRAVDYLLTRSEVDARRVAITGTSGGGTQSAWIGALDPRIAVVIPSCYVTALPMRMANRIFEDPDTDPEQDPSGLVSAGIDHAGLLLLVYPRALFVASAVKDFVPIEGARLTFREVAKMYRRFGHGDRVGMTEGYHEHRFSLENQTAAFAFLDRSSAQPMREGLAAEPTRPPEALRCTPSGQVRVDLPGRSLMPAYTSLSKIDLEDLVAYLGSLRPKR